MVLGSSPVAIAKSLICLKMMFSYILDLIGNKKMWLTLIFWCFIVMIELTVEIKSNILWLTRSKSMALTSEREIVPDNGMSLTCPRHLE